MREGVEEGDGLNLFKIRRTSVKTQDEGQTTAKTEIMILVQCEFNDAHQAIYRTLNQTVATRLRVGVYVFDHDGCQYPDGTMWGEPIDTRLFANNARVNKHVVNPVFIDIKGDRARIEGRAHLSKVQAGYQVARLIGTTDIPRYREIFPTAKSSKLSTRDEPSGLSLGERSQAKPIQLQQVSTTNRISRPTTLVMHDQSMSMPVNHSALVNDRNDKLSRTYRSVLISSPPVPLIKDKRLIINDDFHTSKTSVFERVGSCQIRDQDDALGGHKRINIEPAKPAKRLSVDTSESLSIGPKVRNPPPRKSNYASFNESITKKSNQVPPTPRSLNEMTNKPFSSHSTSRTTQGSKSMSTSENTQHRNFRKDLSSTRVQTTDASTTNPSVNRLLPFKLIPVRPPNKNKIVNINSSNQCKTSVPDKQVVKMTAWIQSVINSSVDRNSVPMTQIIHTPVQDEAMMLEDEAIVSLIMASAPITMEGNGLEVIRSLTPSTRDEVSNSSLGERAQAMIESKEPAINNLPDAACINVPTQVVLKVTQVGNVNHTSRPDEHESANTATNAAEITE